MIEREILLHGTVALLLLCALYHMPSMSRNPGSRGFFLMAAGSLLPLLDPLALYLFFPGRIEVLMRYPLVGAPLNGLLLVAAVTALAAFLIPPGRALRMGAGLAAGYLLHMTLTLLTPVGVPLLAPFSSLRVSLPLFPVGHLPLLAVLLPAVILLETLPRWRRWVTLTAAVLAGLYLLAAPAQYLWITQLAAELKDGESEIHIYPDGSWLLSWQVVAENREGYRIARYRWGMERIEEPRYFGRWNDQALFLKLSGDPIVHRFYSGIFRHPVVNLDRTGSQITLLMQELEDLSPLVPGPTFYLESDLNGRNRFYQLQRFN